MGFQDREYYRDDEGPSFLPGRGNSMVVNIVIVTVVLWIADFFTPDNWLNGVMAAQVDSLVRPWEWWKFLTAGFAHSPNDIFHIGFNMFMLWMFGREVEALYGRTEFLRIYLVSIVVSTVIWALVEMVSQPGVNASVIGASGAVCAVLALFAANFPRRTILIMFVIPAPAWVVVGLAVLVNILGASGEGGGNVAFVAHLAGFAFGFIYFQARWNLGRIVPSGDRWKRIFKRQPRLQVHNPDDPSADEQLSERVDQVLEKLGREGVDSLTRKERRLLEDASRRYQKQRRS